MYKHHNVYRFEITITHEGFITTYGQITTKLINKLNDLLFDFFANPAHSPTGKIFLIATICHPDWTFDVVHQMDSSWEIEYDDVRYQFNEDITNACDVQFGDWILDEEIEHMRTIK